MKTADQLLAGIAAQAHGIVTHDEALIAGVTVAKLRHRLSAGAIAREHEGVYRIGPRTVLARYMAAVMACGEGAVLSGLAAAYCWGLIKGLAPPPEVTAPRQRRLKGVVTHHARRRPVASTTWRRIPITSVPQTLVDIAGRLDLDDLAAACHEAGARRGTTPGMVKAILSHRPNTPGARKLIEVITGNVRVTLSGLERGFLKRLREAALPLPETNRRVDSHRVDCRWPAHRLSVELDSFRYHNSRRSWEQDRKREREARLRGDEFRRYTWQDVFESPAFMLDELRRLLEA